MRKVLSHLKRIEKAAYPSYMRMMQSCRSLEEIAEYAECDVSNLIIRTGENWYCIIADHGNWAEIVDMAAEGVMRDMFSLIETMRQQLSGKRIVLDARVSTTYPIIRRLAQRYRLSILRDEPWFWGEDEMREMEIIT